MTLTIDLPPDVARALEERAKDAGQSVAEFASAVLVQMARLGRERASIERQAERAARLAALERIGSYDMRSRAGLPSLSNEAVSRDSIYEGRGL
jgi:hypothetical protein